MSEQPPQNVLFEKADQIGRLIENAALFLVLGAMIVLAAAQIFMRNFLDIGVAWGDEALRLLVLWVTMLGAMAATRDRRHIVIDVLSRALPEGLRLWTSLLVDGISAFVCGTLAWYAFSFVADSKAYDDRLLNDLPAWPFQLILPFAFAVISYRYIIWCLRHLRAIARGAKD